MAALQILKLQSNQMKKICTNLAKHLNKTNNGGQHFPKKTNFNEANRNHKTIVRNYHSAVAITKKIQPTAINIDVASDEERKEFLNYFPHIVNDVIDTSRNVELPGLANSLKVLTEYNVPYSKKTRGLGTVLTYKQLENSEKLTPDNIRLANILGWCTEMLHAYIVMYDDILDRSLIRHSGPCWYTLDDVKEAATNDGVMLENCLFAILRKYYRNHPCYVHLMELFHDMSLKVCFGQAFDFQICISDKPRFDLFTMKQFKIMGYYKTGYYSFYLPVAAAMYLAGVKDEELHRQALAVLLEIGNLYQIQNDYSDCFGNSGKVGKDLHSDIREGKCTWLAVVALQNATPAQREIMERCYGRSDDESVKAVVNIYEEQALRDKYAVEEDAIYKQLQQQISHVSDKLPREIFDNFLKMIYRRTM